MSHMIFLINSIGMEKLTLIMTVRYLLALRMST